MVELHECTTRELANQSLARWVSYGWVASAVFETKDSTFGFFLRHCTGYPGSSENASS